MARLCRGRGVQPLVVLLVLGVSWLEDVNSTLANSESASWRDRNGKLRADLNLEELAQELALRNTRRLDVRVWKQPDPNSLDSVVQDLREGSGQGQDQPAEVDHTYRVPDELHAPYDYDFREVSQLYKDIWKENSYIMSEDDREEERELWGRPTCDSSHAPMLEQGSWYISSDGHFRYEPHVCTLRRITGEQARTCLAGRHVAFVGDSLSRYQYMSLAHLIAKGVYPERYGGNPNEPSLVVEREWVGSWPDFYANGSARLETAGVNGTSSHEMCDCWRPEGPFDPSGTDQWREDRKLTLQGVPAPAGKVEAMQHHHHSRRSSNNRMKLLASPETNGTIVMEYRQVLANPSIELSAVHAINRIADEARGNQPPHDVPGNNHQPRGIPDVLLLNMAFWWDPTSMRYPESQFRGALRAARALSAPPPHSHGAGAGPRPRLFWRSTTWANPEQQERRYEAFFSRLNSAAELAARQEGWEVLDARAMTRAAADEQRLGVHWDKLHLLPFVYEEMNNVLLNKLCDADFNFVPAP